MSAASIKRRPVVEFAFGAAVLALLWWMAKPAERNQLLFVLLGAMVLLGPFVPQKLGRAFAVAMSGALIIGSWQLTATDNKSAALGCAGGTMVLLTLLTDALLPKRLLVVPEQPDEQPADGDALRPTRFGFALLLCIFIASLAVFSAVRSRD